MQKINAESPQRAQRAQRKAIKKLQLVKFVKLARIGEKTEGKTQYNQGNSYDSLCAADCQL